MGCSMTVNQDRILKVLREFYRGDTSTPYFSYALLNVNEIANTEEPYEKWKEQCIEEQEKLGKALKEKEEELDTLHVRVIWYSAPRKFVDGHESAKRQLFKYILEEQRVRTEEVRRQQSLKKEQANQKNAAAKQKIKKRQTEFENIFSGKDVDDSEAITPKNDIGKYLRGKILTRQVGQARCAIAFPMHKTDGGLYEIYLVSENGKFYLSDEGTTYAELDTIFELKEPDVIKNLVAILKQYGCRKQQDTNAFIIDCTLEDIHIKMSYLIQAISFMLNMKIFYV
jgi:ATPase subunit of ABC transporter with duplicated ATPase domains